MLHTEHQTDDIEKDLVLFSIHPIRFRNSSGFLPIKKGDFLQEAPLKLEKKTNENNKFLVRLLVRFLVMMRLVRDCVFCPFERMDSPSTCYSQ